MSESREVVALIHCDSYGVSQLEESIEKMAEALSLSRKLHGKVVLLKPNLISAGGGGLACTHPQIIRAAAAWYKNNGARVVVGDSPAFGNAARVCKALDITRALENLDVSVVNFDSQIKCRLPCGIDVPIARQALECDLFVGLPKIKAHNQMYVTMAMKNIFGIVTGMSKAMLHMVHGSDHRQFAAIILDLQSLLPEQVHVADGIQVMHGSGPLDGESLALNCLSASPSPVALDAAIHELLELNEKNSPLLREARARGYAGSDGARLDFPLLCPADFHGSGFLAPHELNPVRFNPFRFLRGSMKRALLRFVH